MSKLIYIADDEQDIRNLIRLFLENEGYRVATFETGDHLYEAFLEKTCDLVILDVMMPGNSGFVVCTKLREISDVPIIMLTARDTDEDYISGISLGSDDYFTKPFSPVKLIVRVKAMFRRVSMLTESVQKENDTVAYADVTMYPDKLTAFCNGNELTLTNTEFSMLLYLLENQNRTVSREELLNKVWGYESAVETRATDNIVKRLRRKLNESSLSIDTVWGYGFKVSTKGG